MLARIHPVKHSDRKGENNGCGEYAKQDTHSRNVRRKYPRGANHNEDIDQIHNRTAADNRGLERLPDAKELAEGLRRLAGQRLVIAEPVLDGACLHPDPVQ